MIGVKIRGKKYQACNEWEDITLEKFINLSQITIPEKLEKLWIASSMLNTKVEKDKKHAEEEYDNAQKAITEKDYIKVFPEYYGEVIEQLTDIPKSIINLMHYDIRADLFDQLLRGFVLSLVYSAPLIMKDGSAILYEPAPIESFEMDGETFYFPKSLRLYGDVIPMADEDVAPFAEAADIDLAIRELRRDGVMRFPLFMGIYCRKEGELYSESVALSRAEKFKKVNMSIVWALFFCTDRLTVTLQNSIQRSLMTLQERIVSQI